jgi:hypothetical protein
LRRATHQGPKRGAEGKQAKLRLGAWWAVPGFEARLGVAPGSVGGDSLRVWPDG